MRGHERSVKDGEDGDSSIKESVALSGQITLCYIQSHSSNCTVRYFFEVLCSAVQKKGAYHIRFGHRGPSKFFFK